jgi:adenine phosphoribosyltransferase
MSVLEERIKAGIRDIPDFPKDGIVFKDITPLLNNAELFGDVIRHFADRYRDAGVDHIVGIESRGFIFGAPVAYELGVGFSLARKPGKLPFESVGIEYELEYGTDRIEMHIDGVDDHSHCVILDDVIATGGTAEATARLVEECGGTVHELGFLMELTFLNGRDKLEGWDVHCLASY